MRICKERHRNMRFFVISTNREHMLKAEIFPMYMPVPATADPHGRDPLRYHA